MKKIAQNNSATKNDVQSIKKDMRLTEDRLNKRIDRVTKYIDFKLEPVEKFMEEFRSFKDSVLKSLDWIMLTIKKMDDEHTILTGRYSGVSEKLDNHEERIQVLENKPSLH